MGVSYLTPKAHAIVTTAGHFASVASEAIAAGETVAAFGGTCLTIDQFALLSAERRRRSIQVDELLFLAGDVDPEPADHIEHSCLPNCAMSGAVVLVAARNIEPGEAITYDYAMSDGHDNDGFECRCGAPDCRGTITGRDWMLPDLQLRYRGQFSPYLARRIAALVPAGAERRAFAL